MMLFRKNELRAKARALLLPLVAVSLPISLPTALPAQTLEEGYGDTVRSLPSGAGPVAIVGTSGIAYLDGTRLVFDDGTSSRVLLTLPGYVFGSFLIQVGPTDLLLGESISGDVWRVPFAGSGQPARLASITFNFSAVPYDAQHALISAKTGGFAATDNDVLALDLQTGQVDPIAVIPGASGPLARDRAGNVYYATASNVFPAPLGSVDVLRFDAAAIASAFGPTQLSASDATLAFSGLDSALSLALDGDADLFVVDINNSRVLELSDIDGPSPELSMLVDYSATLPGNALQYLPWPAGPTGAVFEPFQPQGVGVLAIHESQYGSPTSQIRSVAPARARTVVQPAPVLPGPFAITTFGGPSHGAGVVGLGLPGGAEVAIALGGFEQPLLWSFFAGSLAVIPVSFDGSGVATLAAHNLGTGRPLVLGGQVAFVGGAQGNPVLGSGAPFSITLQ